MDAPMSKSHVGRCDLRAESDAKPPYSFLVGVEHAPSLLLARRTHFGCMHGGGEYITPSIHHGYKFPSKGGRG